MENSWNFTPESASSKDDPLCRMAGRLSEMKMKSTGICRLPEFKKITPENMPEVWSYVRHEPGRTTDFSYGGILMWVDFFHYEYCIYRDTLFIKGAVENDLEKPAFSLPVGALPLKESVELVREYCNAHGIQAEFSAVPEYALRELEKLHPVMVEELTDWGDYLYDAQQLASLSGKKMSKKRNHVHQFESRYPGWRSERLTPANASSAMDFMDIFEKEGDSTAMAAAERALSRYLISRIACGDENFMGMLLFADDKVCAYTIGDIKGDTLFIHVEKATRMAAGSYEMINHVFAKSVCEAHPGIKYINREDDAGDIGLRMAKESYHPTEILRKFNVTF